MGEPDQAERIADLERALLEANETLDAIRNGEVDAIVVGADSGQFVYTLENADRPYRVLVEQMKEGAVTLNEEGLILYANRSFGELVGRSATSLVGTCLFDYVDDAESLKGMLAHREAVTAGVSLIAEDGSETPANMSIVELQVEAGAPPMFCSIVTDMTEMRRAEAALRQVQKMDAIGQLTGGVAHDFNNLLMAISSSLAMLEKRLPDDPQLLRLIDNAQQGAQRGAALTQRMLAFARRQDLKPERINVDLMMRNMIDFVQRTLGPTWPLELEFPEYLAPVIADNNQLEMALLNLAMNARDAMPDGGLIRITADQVEVEADIAHSLDDGPYIRLSVIDEGDGMDADTLLRATEPFFTTKGVGKGTGLGLSMVHGLAKQLGGTFLLQSAPGIGTTASLWLPAADDEALVPLAASPAVEPQPARRLKILVVDDDILIRMNVSAMLEDLGHIVLDAGSGEAALEILRANIDTQLLITDQAMPGMTGTELIQLVAAERPELPIILATGYGELPANSPIEIVKLSKPFDEAELIGAMERALMIASTLAQ